MKKKWHLWLLAAALIFAFVQTGMAAEAKKDARKDSKTDGIVITETVQLKAKVEDVDGVKRTVTLKGPRGNTVTLKADASIRNFDQIKKGDRVVATYVESLAVFIAKAGDEPGAGEVEVVKAAPQGDKPAIIDVDTVQETLAVTNIDYKKRKITLKWPDGKTKTVKIHKSVKGFDKIKKGDTIVVRLTEAVAVAVKTP
ncbi:MAG: hypothetical protein KBG09_07420 [Syntrophobacterales bacterium]|jgi:hypothetical protein|nr:hypothetical protein [Syntrophobacterales bacterium]